MIQAILLVFGAVAIIVKFIKSILIKYASHALIIGIQFTITASLIAFVLLFLCFYFNFLSNYL